MQPTSPFWFSLAALFLTIVGLIYNYFNNKATNQISEQAIRLYQGFLEITINNNISEALKESHRSTKNLLYFKKKYPHANDSLLRAIQDNTFLNLVNCYNKICTLYLDGKIDKRRCKIEYKNPIKGIVEEKHFQEKFFTKKNKFPALMKVYDEWENLEK